MNAPYYGKFRVSQQFKSDHDGLDLVGIDSKEIHATAAGKVERAGWENAADHKQGFGQYVRIRDANNDCYYYGHLSQIKVAVGQAVTAGQVIGIEGNTGRSTGSHCHYCVRHNASKAEIKDVCKLSGIPNACATYNQPKPVAPAQKSGVTYLLPGSWNVRKAPSFDAPVARVVKGVQTVTYVDIVPEKNGTGKFYKLRDGNYISVKACK